MSYHISAKVIAANQARSEAAWPAPTIADLTRLYVDDGLTCGIIAQRIGKSKNAVIGKMTRLGLVRGPGFVPTAQQACRLKADELRGPVSTLHSRLDALNAKMDAVLARARPATIVPKVVTDNAMRPFERRRSA